MRLTALTALLLGILAFAMTGSASADVLCEDEPHLLPAEEGEEPPEVCSIPYAAEYGLKGASSAVTLSASGLEVKCESSFLGETKKNLGAGKGLEGALESLSFSGCSGACTAMKAVSLVYKAIVKAGVAGDGGLTLSSGGSGSPGVELTGCTSFKVSCVFTSTELALDLLGGEPAVIQASKEPLKKTGGSGLCPSESSITASYAIQQPPRAYAAVDLVSATVLCKEQLPSCSAAKRHPEATTVEAKVIAPGIKFKWPGGGGGSNTCTGSVIEIVTSKFAAPLLAELKKWTFSGCTCPTTKAMRIPWAGKMERFQNLPNGGMTLTSGGTGNPALEMLGCPGTVNCTFSSWVGAVFKGGAPNGELELQRVKLAELSGGCGEVEIEVGKFKIESPTPLWIERA